MADKTSTGISQVVPPIRISVIMGIYNCGVTLAEALDSLLVQTYQGFKVIMCDDGSTDDTHQVAQVYVDRYPGRFILITNPRNMGLNHTLNHCLKYADTEYVARMDGDDMSLPGRFEQEIGFLDSNQEYAVVSCPMIYFDEKGEFRRGTSPGYSPTKKDFVNGTPFCHAPCMVRRQAYEAVGGYTVDRRLLRVEDYHLWFKMYAAGLKGYVLPEPLYKMRDDRNAIGRRTWRNRLNEAHVRAVGYRMLSIAWWRRVHVLRPIAVGLLPQWLYTRLHRR